MNGSKLIQFSKQQLFDAFFRCCGATNWAIQLSDKAPFNSKKELFTKSDAVWEKCNESDWLEAFTHHPRIGEKQLSEKFAATKKWAGNEQGKVKKASEKIISQLLEGNNLYFDKFGFIFIVCATGKSAEEMLDLLNQRLPNNRKKELQIAAKEQNKITKIRLHKLLENK